jgi:phosphatidylglycerophosphatase GEP4
MPLKEQFEALRTAYPGRRLLIVSNTAGALSFDRQRKLASELEAETGVTVLSHQTKKPGCGDEIMDYFRAHPETGVTGTHEIAIIGDRLTTDMMLANSMGSWGLWIKDGVVPLQKKAVVSIFRLCAAFFCLQTADIVQVCEDGAEIGVLPSE